MLECWIYLLVEFWMPSSVIYMGFKFDDEGMYSQRH